MEREVGEGIGMGNTCKSMADSYQCMTRTTTICKVISLQLVKINGGGEKTKQTKNAYFKEDGMLNFILLVC